MPSQHDSQLHLADVLMEVSIMEMFRDVPGICKLLDFGVTDEGFKLVMPLYQGDLATWRAAQPFRLTSGISPPIRYSFKASSARHVSDRSICADLCWLSVSERHTFVAVPVRIGRRKVLRILSNALVSTFRELHTRYYFSCHDYRRVLVPLQPKR